MSELKDIVIGALNAEGTFIVRSSLPSGSAPSADVTQRALPQPETPVIEHREQETGATNDSDGKSVTLYRPSQQNEYAHFAQMKRETAYRNAYSSAIESTERLEKHGQNAIDKDTLIQTTALLSGQPLLPLKKSLHVNAALPLVHMPEAAIAFIQDVAAGSQARLEMASAGLLGAMFAAARGVWQIREGDHVQPLTGYVLISSASGTGKSTVAEILRRPFLETQFLLQQMFVGERRGAYATALSESLKVEAKILRKKLADYLENGGVLNQAPDMFVNEYEELEQLKRKKGDGEKIPRLLLDQVTMAQLPFELANQGGVAAIIDAEGSILSQIGAGDSTILLKAQTGEYYAKDTKVSGAVEIHHPCLALCLFVQPDKMRRFFQNPQFVDHGLAARMLPLLASESSASCWDFSRTLSASSKGWYEKTVRGLLSRQRFDPEGQNAPRYTLDLTPGALSILRAFHNQIAEGLRAGRFRSCEAFANRLVSHAKNIAGALHLMMHESPENYPIDERAMQGGVAFADYFLRHATAVFDPNGLDGIIFAWKLYNWMNRNRLTAFTEREAHRGVGHCAVEQIRAGIDELQSCNVIRRCPTLRRGTTCVVHPYAYSTHFV